MKLSLNSTWLKPPAGLEGCGEGLIHEPVREDRDIGPWSSWCGHLGEAEIRRGHARGRRPTALELNRLPNSFRERLGLIEFKTRHSGAC